MSVRLVALRHAPTAWNAERRLQGRTDVPLSAEGETAARSWLIEHSVAPHLGEPVAPLADRLPIQLQPIGELDTHAGADYAWQSSLHLRAM